MSFEKESLDYISYVGRSTTNLIILNLIHRDNEHSGYSLIKKIRKLTDNKLNFRAGSLYPRIDKLMNEGFLKKSIRTVEFESKDRIRQKAVYSLTHKGFNELEKRKEEWTKAQVLVTCLIDLTEWDK